MQLGSNCMHQQSASLHCSASGSVMSRPQPSVTEKVTIVSYCTNGASLRVPLYDALAARHENLNVYLSTIRRIICPRIQPYAYFGIVCTTELPIRRLGAQSDEYSNGKDMKVV